MGGDGMQRFNVLWRLTVMLFAAAIVYTDGPLTVAGGLLVYVAVSWAIDVWRRKHNMEQF